MSGNRFHWPEFLHKKLAKIEEQRRKDLEHVYMRPEVNSNRFQISNRFEMSLSLHGNLHRDLTVASFQTIARPYCTCANDIF